MEPYESKWTDDTNRSFDIGKGPEIIPLSDADFDLEKDKDISGWNVLGSDGGKIGEINDLLVDPKSKQVRYYDVEAVEELGREDIPRHFLIPVGAVSKDKEHEQVTLEGVSKKELKACPPFSGCPITRDFEYKLQSHLYNLNPGTANPSPGTDYNEDVFYKHNLFREK